MGLEDVPANLLLGRRALEPADGVEGYVSGARVLVTGAAGSIGSVLSGRLAGLGPRELVLVDQAEAGLVGLVRSLEHDHGYREVAVVLADVRSAARATEIFDHHRPEIVFHAAAYKQVPLLEANPVEAAATNILATRSVVDAARRSGTERFILFSTDKAVRPMGILGRTKAVAEWVVASAAIDLPPRTYGAIRLGNVIDSSGTILPIFRRQIANGEPVTVTHPDAARFLMTAHEAVGLALVAGALADGRSIFWLDVRPAVRVVDIVHRLADAAARDVPIEFIGLRPGERLREHLFWDPGEAEATPCERVFRSPLPAVDPEWLECRLADLASYIDRAAAADVRATLAEMTAAAERAAPLEEALVT